MQKKAPIFLGYQHMPKIKMCYIRKKGSYFQSAISAWQALINDLAKNNIITDREIFYGISQDDPNAMNIEKNELRFDVCVEASALIRQNERSLTATKGEISGGKFAIFLHKGPLEKLSDSYHYLYGKWIFDNEVMVSDARPFIRYVNPFADVLDHEKEAEIYLPIR